MLKLGDHGLKRLITMALVGHGILSLFFIERGLLNADEGWYLYAARQIQHGLQPYTDFASFQAPVFPRVLAGLLDIGPGALISGRWVSGLMMWGAVAASVVAAHRRSGLDGAAIVAITLGLHPLVIATGVLVKPYGLAMALLGGGLMLIAGGDRLRVGLGFLVFGLAVGTRISLMLPVFALLWGTVHKTRFWAFSGLLLGLCLAFWPLVGTDFGVVYHHLVGFHLGNGGRAMARVSWLGWQGLIGLVMLSLFWPKNPAHPVTGLRLAAALGVAVHLLPSANHVEHTVAVAPLLSVALAERWAHILTPMKARIGLVLFGVSVVIASTFVHLDTGPSTVAQTTELGRWLNANTSPNYPLLTQQLALAVEADRDVVSGLQMGRFGFSLSDDISEVSRFKMVNFEMISNALAGPLSGIVLAEEDFNEETRQMITQAANARFSEHSQVQAYGQFSEQLDVWVVGGVLWAK